MTHGLLNKPALAIAALLTLVAEGGAESDGSGLYVEHCASCHGAGRLGGLGPALLPENLGRLTGSRLAAVIAEGRAATQMPPFADKLAKSDIDALAKHVSTPLPSVPVWGKQEIDASRVVYSQPPPIASPATEAITGLRTCLIASQFLVMKLDL